MNSPEHIYSVHVEMLNVMRDAFVEHIDHLGAELVEWDEHESEHTIFDEYFTGRENADQRRLQIKRILSEIDSNNVCTADVRMIENEDWQESWKKHFHAERITQRIIVTPPWEMSDDLKADCIIEIDPGMSFGTGQHPTTRSCLKYIDELSTRYPESTFLDIGCGSGILSIAAAKLGLARIAAIDMDENAVRIAVENLTRNKVIDDIACVACSISDFQPKAGFDIVVANILAHLLTADAVAITNTVARHKDARLILAGCMDEQIADTITTFTQMGFVEDNRNSDGEWTAVCLKRAERLAETPLQDCVRAAP